MGVRHLGVPQSGAADRISFALANAAIGNPWDAPALECALGGLALEFTGGATFSLGGANMAATMNAAPVPLYHCQDASPGDLLKLGHASAGIRCYLAIASGIAGADFLGSVATHLPARLGGIEGRALRTGDNINSHGALQGTPVEVPSYLLPRFGHDWFLRVTPGPEYDAFSDGARRCFFSLPFSADRRADRMGVRLTGGAVAAPHTPPMKSSAVFPGTVQCPQDGAPFLLLSDAQTLGGYPRIAQIIEADLHLAGQIRPGDRIWFRETTPEAARQIAAQRISFYSGALNGFRFS